MNTRTDDMQVQHEAASLVAKYQRRPDLGLQVAAEFSKGLQDVVAQKEARKAAEKKVKPAERQEWKPLSPHRPYGNDPTYEEAKPLNKGIEVPNDYASRGPFELTRDPKSLHWSIRYPDSGECPEPLRGIWTTLEAAYAAIDKYVAENKEA